MILADRIAEITSLEGYQYHRARATDHQGHVQAFTFWFGIQGKLSPYEVRFLVVDEGLPTEWSLCYGYSQIPQPVVTYRSIVEPALANFISNNESYEKGWIVSCDEVNEIAIIGAYEVNNGVATGKTAVVYKVDGNLTVRLLG